MTKKEQQAWYREEMRLLREQATKDQERSVDSVMSQQRPVSDRLKRQAEERRALKERLLEEHVLTGHPKGDKLFELAWEHGHSAGIHEVEIYFAEFAELVKP